MVVLIFLVLVWFIPLVSLGRTFGVIILPGGAAAVWRQLTRIFDSHVARPGLAAQEAQVRGCGTAVRHS
jgi:hypothetical protein